MVQLVWMTLKKSMLHLVKKNEFNYYFGISTLTSGRAPKDSELKAMLEEAQGPVNFTMLLTLFGDRLNGTDEESVILNAWKNFDKEGTGFINQKRLNHISQLLNDLIFFLFY